MGVEDINGTGRDRGLIVLFGMWSLVFVVWFELPSIPKEVVDKTDKTKTIGVS